MTWNPSHIEPSMPPRLAVFAKQVAEVLKDGLPAGFLLVEPESYAEQVGGVLWWRRWSEYRWAAHLWLKVPGLDLGVDVTDSVVAPEDLEGELDDWEADRFVFVGELLSLRWLGAEQSAKVTAAEWG